MKTFDTALFELYQEGLISEEEAVRNSDSANNVRLKIKFAKEGGAAPASGSGGDLGGLSLADLDEDQGTTF
jgi:twitching motility protein PilU